MPVRPAVPRAAMSRCARPETTAVLPIQGCRTCSDGMSTVGAAAASACGEGGAGSAAIASTANGHERAIESANSQGAGDFGEVARDTGAILPDCGFASVVCTCVRWRGPVIAAPPSRFEGARRQLGVPARGQIRNFAPRPVEIPVDARRIAESPQPDAGARDAGGVLPDRARGPAQTCQRDRNSACRKEHRQWPSGRPKGAARPSGRQ